jgi:hypothetical protein
VKELEDHLRDLTIQSGPLSQSVSQDHAPGIKQEGNVLPEELDPLGQHGSNRKYYNWSFATRVTNGGSNQAYGASSTFYFVDQLCSYLDAATRYLQPQKRSDSANLVNMSSSMLSSIQDLFADAEATTTYPLDFAEDLTQAEEERLLQIYWGYYHVLYPILDRTAFTTHYETLWTHIRPSRDPSALVDVLLAVCMQHDVAETTSIRQKQNSSSECSSNSAGGRWFFRRSQYFLQDEIEQPTIMTFQSYALSVLWLSQASWYNAAHNVLAATLRVGVLLGLHLEPSPQFSPPIRAFRRRIWWTVYAMEAQYAMEYGRPIAVNFGQVTCTLTKDDELLEAAVHIGLPSTSFNTQMVRLILAHRSIYILFYRECATVLRKYDEIDMYRDPEVAEICAKWLAQKMGYLQAWLQQVPDDLKTPRQDLGKPFSTDRSRLDLRTTDLSMCRPRILLEISYHFSAMSLYRPFISFARTGTQSRQVIEQHTIACANHAIAITNIIHQDLTELGCLRAWHNICSDQLSAALSLVGYIVTFPSGPVAFTACEAINTAIQNLEILARTFTRAFKSAIMLRNVLDRVNVLHTDLPFTLPHNVLNTRIISDDSPTVQTAQRTTSTVHTDGSHIQRELQNYRSVSSQITELSHISDVDSAGWINTLLDFEQLH